MHNAEGPLRNTGGDRRTTRRNGAHTGARVPWCVYRSQTGRVLKTTEGSRPPWVQIPAPPLNGSRAQKSSRFFRVRTTVSDTGDRNSCPVKARLSRVWSENAAGDAKQWVPSRFRRRGRPSAKDGRAHAFSS